MRVLVTGGSGSGKSFFAEGVCRGFGTPLVYVATMRPFGADGRARVERHRRQRAGAGFVTVERYDAYEELDLAAEVARSAAERLVPGDAAWPGAGGVAAGAAADTAADGSATAAAAGCPAATVLLECAGNVCANLQFSQDASGAWVACADEADLADRVVAAAEALGRQCANLVVVTNEVGADGVAYADETAAYVRALGGANCRLAAEFDAVFEVAAGRPRALKLPEGRGPWSELL